MVHYHLCIDNQFTFTLTLTLESEAFDTTDTTEPADHSVTPEAILPTGKYLSPRIFDERFVIAKN